MSALAWMRRQRDRPIAEHERRTAMVTIVVLLSATTLLLVLTQPAGQPRHEARGAQSRVGGAPVSQAHAAEPIVAPLTPVVVDAADRFLAGYLRYLYGHARASQVQGTTASLARSLTAHPPHVSPSIRASTPRVLALRPAAAPAGAVGVTVLVNDGGLIDYPIGLLLAPHGARLLVSGLVGG
jgi:hypothetical protein